MENSIEIPLKLKIKLPYNPEILLLCIYLKKKKKKLTRKDKFTATFIAAVFTIAKIRKK